MTRTEEVSHIRSIFRQCGHDEAKKIKLVVKIRDIALEYLPLAVIAKVPPPYYSDEIRAAYAAKGISLEWNLSIRGDTGVYPFCFTAARDASMSPSQQSAARLLGYCTEAIDKNAVTEQLQLWILDAYAGLALDDVATGRKFRAGRKPNTGSIIRKKIASLLKKNPAMKNPELWAAVAARPPRGWTAYDNRVGKYLEGTKADDSMGYARFCTVCGEERKKIKR